MEIYHHANLSRKRWGGRAEDYFAIHRLIDSTKVLCSDNRHRIFHTHWAVKEIIVPIFGEVMTNSDGKNVDVKALCEKDHLLVDYNHKFIPTLADFVHAMDDLPMTVLAKRFEKFHLEVVKEASWSALLLSPLTITGQLKSLLITHNSWFINYILPKIFNTNPVLIDFDLTPDLIFNTMRFELWMDNGLDIPASNKHLHQLQISPTTQTFHSKAG